MQYARVPIRLRVREYATPIAVALLLTACVPLLGVLALAARTAAIIVAPVLVLAIGLSFVRWRGLGAWWAARTAPATTYRGVRMSRDVAFHPGHTWAVVDADALVGADDLAQAALGLIDAIELPQTGRRVRRGEPIVRLHHGARTLELPSPVSGTIVATNDALRAHPELVNERPFGAGWVARVHPDDATRDRRNLLVGRPALRWFRAEVDLALRVAGESGAPSGLSQMDDAAWNVLRDALCARVGA